MSDKAEKIERIQWSVYGKISSIQKTGTTIEYGYDASGNRITKTVNGKKDFYVRDAQGNVLGLYKYENNTYSWHEQHLYGSSRVGIFTPEIAANGFVNDNYNYTLANDPAGNGVKGKRHYELTNHLDNVMVIITDRKIGVDVNGDGNVDYFIAEVLSQNDYYVFGKIMPGRQYGAVGRYTFNGKELDKETGLQDYGMRINSGDLGRFLSVDPLAKEYPELTGYQFASNTPIQADDLDGMEARIRIFYHSYIDNKVFNSIETSLTLLVDNHQDRMNIILSNSAASSSRLVAGHWEVHKYAYSFKNGQTGYRDFGDAKFILDVNPPLRPKPKEGISSSAPGKFSIEDAKIGLRVIFNDYGREMAETVEKMYRVETNHFKSKQFKQTGTGGMEQHGPAPYYGWTPSYFSEKPSGLYSMFENKGMSGKGGNEQVTSRPKNFVIMPSVTAAMKFKANYIVGHGGNYARWYSTNPSNQAIYRKQLQLVKSKIVNEF